MFLTPRGVLNRGMTQGYVAYWYSHKSFRLIGFSVFQPPGLSAFRPFGLSTFRLSGFGFAGMEVETVIGFRGWINITDICLGFADNFC